MVCPTGRPNRVSGRAAARPPPKCSSGFSFQKFETERAMVDDEAAAEALALLAEMGYSGGAAGDVKVILTPPPCIFH